MVFSKQIIIGLCIIVFQVAICNGQCISDDSIRHEIDFIKNDLGEIHFKIHKLTALRLSYLKCHPKAGAVYAEIMHRLGDCYAKAGSLEKGVAYTYNAIKVNEHTGRREPFLCNSYYNLGIFYWQLNFVHQANDCFNRCIQVGKIFPEKYFIVGMAHTQLAYSFYKAGDYQQARDIATKGMAFSKAAGDTVQEAAQWTQKAQAEIELNDYKEAEKSIFIALRLLGRKANSQLASAYSVYADFLNATGNPQTSVIYYKKAYLLNKQLQNFVQCANDLNDLGYVYDNALKQQDNARKWYSEGAALARKNDNSYQLAGFYENFGVTYWKQHDYKTALIYYQKGLNALPIKFNNKLIISNPEAGVLSQISNDYYVSSLFDDKAESLLALYKKTGKKSLLNAALQTFLLADRSVDMMRWKQYGELSKLLWRRQTKQMYEHAIEVCYLLNDPESAFYFFEKSRSVLLNDQLNASLKPRVTMDEKLRKQLLVKIDSLNQQLTLLNSNQPVDQLKTEWLTAYQTWEYQQSKLTAKLFEDPVVYSNVAQFFKITQRQLASDKQSLIEYFNNDSMVYILLVTPIKANIYKITYRSYLHDSSKFLEYCSDASLQNQHYDHYVTLANKLYQKLFKPLHIDNQRVIISPGDHFISFDALLDEPNSDESFLIKKYSFSYVYSMRVLLNRHLSSIKQKTVFLGVAPEKYSAAIHLQPLIGSVASLQRIQGWFGSSVLLEKEEAKRKRLLSQLPQSQIVQIYSHATADSTTRDPVLYMADSVILMSDIQKLRCQRTDIVVLSACNTGTGYMAIGEGIFSLARGFRLAGIPCTVTNLWQADNKATYKLTESFYKYLSLKVPKDQAMRLAKLDCLKNDQSHLLPYYWAATIVLGDSSALNIPLSQTQHPLPWLVIISSVIIVLLSFLYFFSYRQRRIQR